MFAECTHALTAQYGLTISLFLAGLVGSVTHCAGMCGPFILAQSKSGPSLEKPSSAVLLPYHLGRMTTYILMGILLHNIINLSYLFSETRVLITVPLLTLAGIVFLVNAFPKLGTIFPWAIKITLPAFLNLIAQQAHRALLSHGNPSRYLLGLTLGMMPCGLVVAALMASATAPTTSQAALAMAAFSLGTMPSLILIGYFGKGLSQKFPALSQHASRFAMVASSLWLFTLAGSLIF